MSGSRRQVERMQVLLYTIVAKCCSKHMRQVVTLLSLIIGLLLLILMNTDVPQNPASRHTLLRGKLKSTGNYSMSYETTSSSPITWKALDDLLLSGASVSLFPTQFYNCLPNRILKVKQIGHFNRLLSCNRIFYNRVPKCGSRTMISVFKVLSVQRNYTVHAYLRPEKRSFFKTMQKLVTFGMNFSQVADPFIYSMHLHYVNFTQLGISPPIYINVIRDPIDRVISHFYYNKYGSGSDVKHPHHNMSLDECVSSLSSCPFLPVYQVLPYFCGHAKSCRSNSHDTLQRAKKALRTAFLVVGITEDLPAFLKVLEKLMPNFFTNATNVFNEIEDVLINKTQTIKKSSVQPGTIKSLKDMLHNEYEFYNYAKQRFYTLYYKLRSLQLENVRLIKVQKQMI